MGRNNRRGHGGHRNHRRGNRNRNHRGSRNSGIPNHFYTGGGDDTQTKKEYVSREFSEFDLHPKIHESISKIGFNTATEIQDKTIPMILENKNILGFSSTGSGKTAAFLIPILNKILHNRDSEKALVIAPTRELAIQIRKEAIRFVQNTNINISLVIGGESMGRQINQLQRGDEFIIGTPGRIKDMMQRRKINPQNINNIIVDEVDRMLDMGFIDDVQHFFKHTANDKQSLFFSATHNKSVDRIVGNLANDFHTVKVDGNNANNNVDQKIINFSHNSEKINLLNDLLSNNEVEKAIIFVSTRRYADRVTQDLSRSNHRVKSIHGGKRQNQRKRIFNDFKDSKVNFLVATNVAARGLDVDDITHVINLDEPESHDEYIHRVGRTGRNGRKGTAYTFVGK